MMQDCTHIRALEGSQTLLTWSNGDAPAAAEAPTQVETEQTEVAETQAVTEITPQTRLKDLLAQYPTLKSRLPELDSKFKMLNTPLGRLMIGKVDIQAMSDRTGMPLEQLIEGIKKLIR